MRAPFEWNPWIPSPINIFPLNRLATLSHPPKEINKQRVHSLIGRGDFTRCCSSFLCKSSCHPLNRTCTRPQHHYALMFPGELCPEHNAIDSREFKKWNNEIRSQTAKVEVPEARVHHQHFGQCLGSIIANHVAYKKYNPKTMNAKYVYLNVEMCWINSTLTLTVRLPESEFLGEVSDHYRVFFCKIPRVNGCICCVRCSVWHDAYLCELTFAFAGTARTQEQGENLQTRKFWSGKYRWGKYLNIFFKRK